MKKAHYRIIRKGWLKQKWSWQFFSANGKQIARSSEAYHNRVDCMSSIYLINESKKPIYEKDEKGNLIIVS